MARKRTGEARGGDAARESGGDESPPLPSAIDYDAICKQYPRTLRDGSPNPEHYRYLYSLVVKLAINAAAQFERIPFNADQLRSFIDAEAEASGLDPKALADVRTPEEKALEAARVLASAPEKLLEIADEEIDAVERAMDTADRMAAEYVAGKMAKGPPDPKGWRRRIKRVRRLRVRARRAVPLGTSPNQTDQAAAEAAHTIRFMLYVGRSNMPRSGMSRAAYVFLVGEHTVAMSAGIWEFEQGIGYTETKVNRDAIPYSGVAIFTPPGHGKTELIVHWCALEMQKNHRTQGQMLNAIADNAEKNLAYLANCLDPDTDVGRRYLALFPDMGLDHQNASRLWIRTEAVLKEATWAASGDKTAALGQNTNVIVGDDMVPQSDADQDTERERRFNRFNGTWLSRQRGRGCKLIIGGNIWHHDDLHSRIIKQAERAAQTNGREGSLIRVVRLRCGGPKTTPPFYPLWRDVYPAQELRRRFNMMQNPRLWASAYELNPSPDELRVVRRLRYYNPFAVEHRDFLLTATNRLSIDPSATRNLKSDKAGVLRIAQGEMRTQSVTAEGREFSTEKRLRVVDAWRVTANQVDIVEWSLEKMRVMPTDYLHVESRSGFNATGDIFEQYHGIPVIRYDPKNKDKKERLKAVAPMLEDGYESAGIRACVEFPCEVDAEGLPVLDDQGRMQPAEGIAWLANQILNFGFTGEDDGVDALTQVLIDQMGDMTIGTGRLTQFVRADPIDRMTERRQKELLHLRGIMRGASDAEPWERQDERWMANQWN